MCCSDIKCIGNGKIVTAITFESACRLFFSASSSTSIIPKEPRIKNLIDNIRTE